MRRLSVLLLAILSVALLVSGCRPRSSGSSAGNAAASAPPKVALFLASPNPVSPGDVTSLGWALEGGGEDLTCALDTNGDGKTDVTVRSCPQAGSRTLTAAGAGSYRLTLTVRDAKGRSASQSTTLHVIAGAGAPAAGAGATTAPAAAPAPGSSDAAPEWARTLASDAADTVTGVATDPDGDAVVVGFTAGSLEGGASSGANDAFVAKLDPDGKTLWLRQVGGSADDRAMGVALAPDGGVYVTGQTSGNVPGGSSSGAGDAFLVKFDANGERQWVRQFGTSGADVAAGVAVGPTGNVFVAGDTNGTFTGNGYAGGDRDAYVAKFDASGDLVWIRQFGSPGDDRGRGVAVDQGGNVVVTGFTRGAMPTNAPGGEADAYLAKFDGNGQRVWLRQLGGEQADFAYAVAIAGASDIVVTGDSYGTLPGGRFTGIIDGFAARYDANGNRRWLTEFGAADAVVFANGVAVDSGGDIVLSGYSNSHLKGSGGQPGYFLTFVTKLSPSGQRLWLREFGDSATELKTGVGVDGQGRITAVSTGAFVSAGQDAGAGGGSGSSGAGGASSGSSSATPAKAAPMHVLVVQYPP